MKERTLYWKEAMRGRRWHLYTEPDKGGELDLAHLSDRALYATVNLIDERLWEPSYWELAPPDEGDDPLMCGDWVDLPMVQTLEEAKLIAENIVRLNMGGWP